jgi:hypothetical protein
MHQTQWAEELLKSKQVFKDFGARYGINITHACLKMVPIQPRLLLAFTVFTSSNIHPFVQCVSTGKMEFSEQFISSLATHDCTILLQVMIK